MGPEEPAVFSQAGLRQPVRPLNDDHEIDNWWSGAHQPSGDTVECGEPENASLRAGSEDDRLGPVDELGPVPQEGCEEFEQGPDGLSHSGDPEEEGIVVEEPSGDGSPGPVVVRAPRAPAQRDRRTRRDSSPT